MPDTVHHVMWYTVDTKTGDLIATDTPQKKEPAGAPTPTGFKG